jgi:predicted dehydrogenase
MSTKKRTDILNVALVGCGRIGEREASAVVSLPDLKLVAVSDVGPGFREKALKMSDRYECDAVHNWRHLVVRDDIDMVIVSTPTSFHKDISVEAMKHGKHVLVEKPLAATVDDAVEMVQTAQAHGVKLMTNFNHRRHDHNQRAREILERGLIGRPTFLRGRIGHGRFVIGASPAGGGRFLCEDSWYTDMRQAGGGALIDNGVHLFDLARWFFDEEFVEAQGMVTRNLDVVDRLPDRRLGIKHKSECEDNGFGLFRTADGRVASVHSSWTQWQGYLFIEVSGTHGCMTIDNDQIQGTIAYHVFNRHGDPIATTKESPALLKPDPSWRQQLEEMIASIREDREPSPNGVDGLMSVRMAEAVYRSAACGEVQPIETHVPSVSVTSGV